MGLGGERLLLVNGETVCAKTDFSLIRFLSLSPPLSGMLYV